MVTVQTDGTIQRLVVSSLILFSITIESVNAQSQPQFSLSGLTVNEGAGYAEVIVTSDPAVRQPTTVEYATTSGSAINGEDYWGAHEVIEFIPGQTEHVISVDILDDARSEQTESFTVRIFRPSDGSLVNRVAEVRIEDNDADNTPTLTILDAAVTEGSGIVEIPVRLSAAAPAPVQVSIATAPASASNRVDFYGVFRRIVFTEGQIEARIGVDIVDDTDAETQEQFTARLFNATVPVTRAQATVTIRDDDDSGDQRSITTTDNPNPPYDGISGTFPSSTHLPPHGFPVIETTGVPEGTVLSPHSGRLIVSEDNAVVDSLDVTGFIDIKANNVTIKNTRVTGTGGTYLVRVYPGFSNLVIEDSRLRGVGLCSAVICCSNYTARRVLVTGCADGLKVGDNTVVEDSLITELYRGVDSQGRGSHNDGIQAVGGNNMTIRRNTILGPYQMSTSAIIFKGDFATIENSLVESNYLSGGSYTVYTRKDDFDLRNVIVRNNTFENNSFLYGYKSSDTAGAIWTDNEFYDP